MPSVTITIDDSEEVERVLTETANFYEMPVPDFLFSAFKFGLAKAIELRANAEWEAIAHPDPDEPAPLLN